MNEGGCMMLENDIINILNDLKSDILKFQIVINFNGEFTNCVPSSIIRSHIDKLISKYQPNYCQSDSLYDDLYDLFRSISPQEVDEMNNHHTLK